MFDETLRKFALVIGLFVVFVILGNFFAASQQAAGRRAASIRRRGRRARRLEQRAPGALGDEPGSGEAPQAGLEPDDEEEPSLPEPSLKRRLLPQLTLSAVALALAGLALWVMWRVADSA